jgi:hypothetical protein
MTGGCACEHVRFQFKQEPLFVHCCHCTRCQRETGSAFAHHAVIEFNMMEVTEGTAEFWKVPADSGRVHWVARCPKCATALWNEWGSKPIARYVRVGVMDEPNAFPPGAHIYVRSKQPWLTITGDLPASNAYYDAEKIWPVESRERYANAKEARERVGAEKRVTRG